MSRCRRVGQPIVRSLQQGAASRTYTVANPTIIAVRQFSTTPRSLDVEEVGTPEPKSPNHGAPPPPSKPADPDFKRRKMDPNVTTFRWAEAKLMRAGTPPIGSRRRRVAIRTSDNVPFEQLPYQCFQEARKILNADREEKIAQIVAETAKIKRLEAADASTIKGGEATKQRRITSMRKYVEELKILADINDPLVKRRFEDGQGDMSKPIYRYLANRRWRSMERKITMQRINQFYIVPDLLPKLEPTADVKLFFDRQKIPPGEILDSRITELPPRLRMQVFDKGERLVSVVVVDADVPDPETDTFSRRCHFLAANIPWDPTKTSLPLSRLDAAVPWLPPTSQKGAPYHRLAIFVLEQSAGPASPIDAAKLTELYGGAGGRDGFSLKSFRDKFGMSPVGFTMFRTVWDEGTAEVMERHGIPGAEVEFKQPRVHSLKPPRKARGWEAKRQKAKYKFLWKYTKRIA